MALGEKSSAGGARRRVEGADASSLENWLTHFRTNALLPFHRFHVLFHLTGLKALRPTKFRSRVRREKARVPCASRASVRVVCPGRVGGT